MALNPLILAENLRPWRTAGLLYVLRDPQAEPVVEEISPDVSDMHDDVRADSIENSRQNFIAGKFSDPSIPRSTTQGSADNSSQALNTFAKNTTSDPTEPSPLQQTVATQKFEVAVWTPKWKELYLKTAQTVQGSRAQVLWTYTDLVWDLAKQGEPKRGELLRNLIQALALPRGSSVFWPSSILGEADEKEPNPGVFYNGLCKLNPKAVFLLGASSIEEGQLPISLQHTYTTEIFQGRMYVLLPDWESLLTPSVFQASCAFLRTTIQQLNIS